MSSTRKDLARETGKRAGVSGRKALTVNQHFIDVLLERILKEGRVELRNFGVFKVVYPSPREVIHPRTGERYMTYGSPKVTFNSRALRKYLERELEKQGYNVRPQNLDAFVRAKAMSFDNMVMARFPPSLRGAFMSAAQKAGLSVEAIDKTYVQCMFSSDEQLGKLRRLAKTYKGNLLVEDFAFAHGVIKDDKFYVAEGEPDDYNEVLYQVYNVASDGRLTFTGKRKIPVIDGHVAESQGEYLKGREPTAEPKKRMSTADRVKQLFDTKQEPTPDDTEAVITAYWMEAQKRLQSMRPDLYEEEVKPRRTEAMYPEAPKNRARTKPGKKNLDLPEVPKMDPPAPLPDDIDDDEDDLGEITGGARRPKKGEEYVSDAERIEQLEREAEMVKEKLRDVATFNAGTIGVSKRVEVDEVDDRGRKIKSKETNPLYTYGKSARVEENKLRTQLKNIEGHLKHLKSKAGSSPTREALPPKPETTNLSQLTDKQIWGWFNRNRSYKNASAALAALMNRSVPSQPDDARTYRGLRDYLQRYMLQARAVKKNRSSGTTNAEKAIPIEHGPEDAIDQPTIADHAKAQAAKAPPKINPTGKAVPLKQLPLPKIEEVVDKNASDLKVLQAALEELIRRRGSVNQTDEINRLKKKVKRLRENLRSIAPEAVADIPAPKTSRSRRKPVKQEFPEPEPESSPVTGREYATRPYSSKPGGRPDSNIRGNASSPFEYNRTNWTVRFRSNTEAQNAARKLRAAGVRVIEATSRSIVIIGVGSLAPYADMLVGMVKWGEDPFSRELIDQAQQEQTPNEAANQQWQDLTIEAGSASAAAAIMMWLMKRTPMRYVAPDRGGKFQVKLEKSLAASLQNFINMRKLGVVTRRSIIRPLARRIAQFFKSPTVRQAAVQTVASAVSRGRSRLKPGFGPASSRLKPKSGPGPRKINPAVPMGFSPGSLLKIGKWILRTASEQSAYAAAAFLLDKGARVLTEKNVVQVTGASKKDMEETRKRFGGQYEEAPVSAALPALGAGLWAAGKWLAPVVGQWLILTFLDKAAAAAAAADMQKRGIDAKIENNQVKVLAKNPAANAAVQEIARKRRGRLRERKDANKGIAASWNPIKGVSDAWINTAKSVSDAADSIKGGVNTATRIGKKGVAAVATVAIIWSTANLYSKVRRVTHQYRVRRLLRDMSAAGLRIQVQNPTLWTVQGDVRPFLGRLRSLGVVSVQPITPNIE